EYGVRYEPAESSSGLFGGNSNWRGPVWFPVNFLLIEALQKFHHYLGEEFTVEFPTGSGRQMTLAQVAAEISRRLSAIFLLDQDGRRPAFGKAEKLQRDPHFRDYLLFHEYFNGDDGSGVGANLQTGWTGLLSRLDEVISGGGVADVALATNQYPGTLSPRGYAHLIEFRLDPFPTWVFDVGGAHVEKQLFLVQGEQTVVVLYRSTRPRSIAISPFLAYRDYHALSRANASLDGSLREERTD